MCARNIQCHGKPLLLAAIVVDVKEHRFHAGLLAFAMIPF
jgi:hypothetical protein